ncbi:ParB N-terminal domain-containing protein [Cupriavidus necator]|uniref:H-NS family nucleoid-associated regulatory protein n=1 Tax=Cupriavidus necator TaxID=106590 RepID=UPI0039C09A71
MTTPQNTATLQQVPLSQLILSPRNARQTSPKAISELAALLDSQGQLQNLIVTEELADGQPTGRFEVAAGGRRWRAMQLLVERGRWTPDHLVDVKLRDSEQAEEASLAENSAREAMHPADEFEAFKRLIDAGTAIEDIAARFGVTPLVVQRRLKLANVSPKMIQVYRAGEASLEQLMALAITDDHKAQERVWKDSPSTWERTPEKLRSKLAKGDIEVRGSKLAKYVGLAAYEAAGGHVERDLFSDADNGFLSDGELLERLASEKLEDAAVNVRYESWSWVEIRPDFMQYQLYNFSRLEATTADLTKDQKARVKALEKQKAEIDKRIDALEEADDYGDEHDELRERAEAIDDELQAIEQSRQQWDDNAKAKAGAILAISDAGVLQVYRGLIAPASTKDSKNTAGDQADTKKPAKPALSESLARRLTAHRTAALQLHLVEQPHIALALLVHKLLLSVTARASYENAGKSAVRISLENRMESMPSIADDLQATTLRKKLQATRTELLKGLPKSNSELLPHLIALPQQDLLQLLALCTATSVDAIAGSEGPNAADAVAEAVDLDMSQWWTATGDSYLQHVPKAKVVEAVEAAAGKKEAAPLAALKKDGLIAAAEQKLAGTGWLPKILQGKKTPAKKTAKPAAKTPAASKIAVRYRDENGNTWTGRGKRPGWIEAALKDGKTLDELLATDAQEVEA